MNAPTLGQSAASISLAPDAPPTVSVVVPARNEEGTVGEVIERSFAAFAELGCEGEVLVVNDGSTDRTAAVLAEACTRYPTLRVFTHRRSQGMTAGLQTMFRASRGDIVILIPADMESDPLLDVPALVQLPGGARPGCGGRLAAGTQGQQGAGQPRLQRRHARIWRRPGARRQLDQGHAPRGGRQFPAAAQRLAPLPAHDRRPQRLSHRRDANLLPAAPGRQQQVWLGAHPQELSGCAGAQVSCSPSAKRPCASLAGWAWSGWRSAC